jgi:hypothetical protein
MFKQGMVINLCPHPVTVKWPDGHTQTLEPDPSGPARVSSSPGRCLGQGPTCAVLYAAPQWGEVDGLPSASEDTIYIVSLLVASRCAGRKDVFSPGTGPNDGAIRDEQGRIQAVTRLVRAPDK